MFVELIAVFVAGFAGAGLFLVVRHALGRRLPRWLLPLSAGAAMIAATISSEYSWFDRTARNLPEGMEVASRVETQAPFRPWSYLFPYVDRFAALDRQSVSTKAGHPEQRLGRVYFYGRWSPVRGVTIMADCEARRRALVPDEGAFDAPQWVTPPAGDDLVEAFCEEGLT